MKKIKKEKCKWALKKPLYLDVKDKRYKKHVKQLKEDGFSNAETWSLYNVITDFTLPRLKRFREIHMGYPACYTAEKWKEILDEIIFAFEWVNTEDDPIDEYIKMTDKERKANWKRYEKGMKLFATNFMGLWW